MTTNSRTDALIRDIAKLFVTYPASVWRPVLDELRTGGESQKAVAEAVEVLLASTASAKRGGSSTLRSPAPKSEKIKASPPEFSPARREILMSLRDAINARNFLPTLKALREFYLAYGGKAELPKHRGGAVSAVLHHLDGLSDEAFSRAVLDIRNMPWEDRGRDYDRWFELIRPGSRS